MGVYRCNRNHITGIGDFDYTCKHISDNIDKNKNEPCMTIRVRIYNIPGYLTNDKETQSRFELLTLCFDCIKNWELTDKVKIEYQPDMIEKAVEKYELVEECPECLREYVERNRSDK